MVNENYNLAVTGSVPAGQKGAIAAAKLGVLLANAQKPTPSEFGD
jgi:hypothetical protein